MPQKCDGQLIAKFPKANKQSLRDEHLKWKCQKVNTNSMKLNLKDEGITTITNDNNIHNMKHSLRAIQQKDENDGTPGK